MSSNAVKHQQLCTVFSLVVIKRDYTKILYCMNAVTWGFRNEFRTMHNALAAQKR